MLSASITFDEWTNSLKRIKVRVLNGFIVTFTQLSYLQSSLHWTSQIDELINFITVISYDIVHILTVLFCLGGNGDYSDATKVK